MAVQMLSQNSRNSHLTPYAHMVLAEGFLLIAALVVLGSTADLASNTGECKGECIYGIISSIGAAAVTGLMVLVHLGVALTWLGGNPISLRTESYFLTLLLFAWIPTVSALSAVRGVVITVRPRQVVLPTSGSGLVFAWLYAVACVYANWKAYHASQEEATAEASKARAEMVPEDEETFANFS